MQVKKQRQQQSESQGKQALLQANQSKKSPHLKSSKKTNTYKLTTNLDLNDERLQIILYDYIDYTVYSKKFTDADIGKEIHKRVVLDDIYASLASECSTKSSEHNIQHSAEGVQKSLPKEEVYNFGDIMYAQDVPCFKIEKNGKLTVFVSFSDRKSKKDIIFESVLVLDKKMMMADKQILKHKLNQQKQEQTNKLLLYIQKSQKQISTYKNQVVQLTNRLNKSIQELMDQKQRIRECIKAWNDESQPQLPQQKQQKQCEQQSQQLQQQQNRSTNNYHNSRYKILQHYERNQPNYQQFRITKKMIQKISTKSEYVQYYVDYPIPTTNQFVFYVKMVRVTNRVCVGVIDYNKCKDKRSSFKQGYSLYYENIIQNNTGYLHNFTISSNTLSIKKYKTKQSIGEGKTMEIKIKDNKIFWNILNSSTKLWSLSLDVFEYQNCMLVPAVEIYDQNDIMEVWF